MTILEAYLKHRDSCSKCTKTCNPDTCSVVETYTQDLKEASNA